MKTRHIKEDLIHNLPDYVLKKIEDVSLISAIEEEIEINPDFKNEYEDIRNTFDFLSSAELEAPHENYFNNLSVIINNRAENENNTVSIWEKISLKWKLLVPVISMIIISLILLNNFEYKEESNITNNVEVKEESAVKTENQDVNNSIDLQTQNEKKSDTDNLTFKKIKQSNTVAKRNVINGKNDIKITFSDAANSSKLNVNESTSDLLANNSEISENSINDAEEDILIINDTDEDNFDDELMEFTPEEQKEILENLDKSQI